MKSTGVTLIDIVCAGSSPARHLKALVEQGKFSDLWKGSLRFTALWCNNFSVLHCKMKMGMYFAVNLRGAQRIVQALIFLVSAMLVKGCFVLVFFFLTAIVVTVEKLLSICLNNKDFG